MRRVLISLILALAVPNLSAAWNPERSARARHYIVDATRALPDGAVVVRPLSGGRQLVRVAPGVAVGPAFQHLRAEDKIDRRALRAASSARTFVDVSVQFHDDVPFDTARTVITGNGGALENALQFKFDVAARVRARVPSANLLELAADERVLIIFGTPRLRPALDNRTTAAIQGVAAVHQAPYDLTGEGVVLSFFEFAPADASHRDFQGRLITHLSGSDSGDIEHATHVAGTIIAAGLDSLGGAAKGMAPSATLHQFSARGDEVFSAKEDLTTFQSVADNNSWGYVLGWCGAPSCEGWVWDDTEEYYGAYDSFYVAPLDRIARSTGVLFVHSAGNDAEKVGPQSAPFAHQHTDENGEIITGTFCYSANGSGTDCPAPTCTAGSAPGIFGGPFCEVQRHPQIIAELPAPFGSLGLTASAKNSIAVGAISAQPNNPGSRLIASFSSRGPARDGRVKPELVARGVSVYSTLPGGAYGSKQGTSMASPAVTGMAGLLTQQWRRTFAGETPHGSVLKTLLIAGAEDVGTSGPDYTFGFGMANVKNSVDLVIADGAAGRRIRRAAMDQGGSFEVPVSVASGQALRVVLGWSDPEVIIFPSDGLATQTLVNDLDVKVITPSGTTVLPYVLDKTQPTAAATRGVNTVDNTEMVEIANAAPGQYRIVVTGSRITAQAPQQFVLVSTADLEAAAPPCIDEPNNSQAAAQALSRGATVSGRICDSSDADFFSFVSNEQGTVSVTITAGDTALRATVTSTATAPASVDVSGGTSRTVNVPFSGAAATTFFVRVAPVGAVGSEGTYTVSADYPFNPGARRRAVRR